MIYALAVDRNNCLSTVDYRLKHSSYQQAINPFSKKTSFPKGICTLCLFEHNVLVPHVSLCLGLSGYFPDNNLRGAKMKSGGLEAQRTGDLLFWLVFAIGTEGCILPNSNGSYRKAGVTKHFNPTKVVLTSLVANLELLWYSRCSSMTVTDITDTLKRVCSVADAHYTRLLGLSLFVMDDEREDCSVKRHIWKEHMPEYFFNLGANIYNDTDLPEHGHIDDKRIFERTSKRYRSNLTEMANKVMNMTSCHAYV
jgi:hypothetical protein